MPSIPLYDRAGKNIGDVELSDELFAAPVNTAVLHQVVTAQLAARRTGTSVTVLGVDGADGRAPEGERRPANLEDVFVLLTGEEIE